MLKSLSIENYALIRRLRIDFKDGLSVITGETGAGKSIILGALGLILGNRADTQVLLQKDRKCIVEGSFDISGYDLSVFYEENELDFENVTILRREINKSGKSRAFINDTPVNLIKLRELGDKLVNVHSQHKTITLNDSEFQLAVVDDYVNHPELIKDYKSMFNEHNQLNVKYRQLVEAEKNSRADEDYYQFLYDELKKASLIPDEQKELESELEILNNSEEIKMNLGKVNAMLSGEGTAALNILNEISNLLNPIEKYHSELGELNKRIRSNIIDLKDIDNEIGSIEEGISYDPGKLEEINERLNLLYSLQQKHRVQTTEELIQLKEKYESKLQSISSLEGEIEKLKKEIDQIHRDLSGLAKKISENRKIELPSIEKKITKILQQLGMPEAQFKVSIEPLENFGKEGKDSVTFLFNANKGGRLDEVSKIASGGELSRLMLSIKSLISHKNLLPTIIFDEIDMGVSGDIANKVGDILLKMATSMQVIAITHLPQIAGKGKTHYLVYKDSGEDITTSYIKQSTGNERLTEIAKMLSGEKVTSVALENARELIVHGN